MDPATMALLVGTASKFIPGMTGGGGSSAPAVNVSQSVSQNQAVNIGSSDLGAQLAALVGTSSPTQYPVNTSGQLSNVSDLFNNALGVSVPIGGGIADPRYSVESGGITAKNMDWNKILLIIGGALLVFIVLKKIRGA